MKVTILLLTKNAGPRLDLLLAGVDRQEFSGEVELSVIDSGSTDGTLERLQARGISPTEIAPEDFSHGLTRDAGIERSDADVVVLLVQDAVPVGTDWLANLVQPFSDPDVAGATARQVPQPDCPVVTAHRIRTWLTGQSEPRTQRLADASAWGALTPMERLHLCVFDNVCSAIRRSVWERIPFGSVAFAEDLHWAKKAILAGHALAYAPGAVVEHSHHRSVSYEVQRTYISHRTLFELFEIRTIPDRLGPWRSLFRSGPLVRRALREAPGISRKVAEALRAPWEEFATARAQERAGRHAARGDALPPKSRI